MSSLAVSQFLDAKRNGLVARARRLRVLTPQKVGLRPQDMPFAPSAAHFVAANKRLEAISGGSENSIAHLASIWPDASPADKLAAMAIVERTTDRARRSFGMFFEIFSQRGSSFARSLAAHDVIAADCYRAVNEGASDILKGPLLKPVTYLEHGYSPATMRRGIQLARLMGDSNPFPVIRIPWDRDNPWQSVFLHEVAHNLQADMGLWHENQVAIENRLMADGHHPGVVDTYKRWHKEIFADLAAVLLGGPTAAIGMLLFLAQSPGKVLTYRAGGAHPTSYLRAFLLAAMVERLGFGSTARHLRLTWKTLYRPSQGHRVPTVLLQNIQAVASTVIDEIVWQPRRALGQRALADVIRFESADEAAIQQGVLRLMAGRVPSELPPRFIVSAAGLALGRGASVQTLSRPIVEHLSALAAREQSAPVLTFSQAA